MAINVEVDDIEPLEEQLAKMPTISSRPDTPTPIPFTPTAKKAPEPAVAPTPQPLLTPFVLPPSATWATVAKKEAIRKYNPLVKPIQILANTQKTKSAAKKVPQRETSYSM